jgi:hypothetical protein
MECLSSRSTKVATGTTLSIYFAVDAGFISSAFTVPGYLELVVQENTNAPQPVARVYSRAAAGVPTAAEAAAGLYQSFPITTTSDSETMANMLVRMKLAG